MHSALDYQPPAQYEARLNRLGCVPSLHSPKDRGLPKPGSLQPDPFSDWCLRAGGGALLAVEGRLVR